MPTPAYVTILDAQIDPESPITQDLMTALRDNLLSVLGGGVGAPRLQTGILAIGGSIADGLFDNTFASTARGYYDLSGSSRTTNFTLPGVSVVRVRGNQVISSTLTVPTLSDAQAIQAQTYHNAVRGNQGSDGSGTGASGGGSVGDGGNAVAPTPAAGGVGFGNFSGFARPFVGMAQRPIIGGRGGRNAGARAEGGGALILFVEGNLDMTGGVINADGAAGADAATSAGAGGGGGSILVICTGTITNGTFRARGGAGGTGASTSSGGGGGGAVLLVAAAYSGVQTLTVTGGAHTDSGGETSTAGSAGNSQSLTLSEPLINGLYWR